MGYQILNRRNGSSNGSRFSFGYVFRLSSEHITICEIEISYEEITSVSLVIEVRSQMAHHVIEIVALIHDVLSEILLRIPLAHIAILEAINAVIVEANK